MARRQRRVAYAATSDAGDSDASFSPEDEDLSDIDEELSSKDDDSLFDVEGDRGPVTDATDTEDLFCDEADVGAEFDVEDQIQLFGGNVHPPEYYRQAVLNLNTSEFDSEDYSPGTTLLLDSVEENWRLYCGTLDKNRDIREYYEYSQGETSPAISLLYFFFEWSLNQKEGKNGRRKRGIQKKSTLGTYWKVFRLVFERALGDKIDPKVNRSMHKVLRKLAKLHGLGDQKRENRGMTIDDLKEQIETTLSTTKKSFKLGELRIYAVLFLLLLAAPGARPTSILRLRFGDTKVVLSRDPEGGPHNLLIKYALAFTKTFLGEKATNTITIPETIFDPCLFLSPHVFLLGILFRHRAFCARHLISPHQLNNVDISPGEREMLLPLREDLDNIPIFRQAVETLTGYELSPDKPISYGMMAAWIKRIGEILGCQYTTIPYNLRYNAANELDQSSWISEALRNLTLDHADSGPFRRHYLGRQVGADVWGIIRGQEPQQALVKQSNSLGHSISKRRPIDLTPEQAASITTHPLIRRLTKGLEAFRRGSKDYKEARRVIRKEKHRLRRELKQRIRDEWTANQAVEDIERQLQGLGFAKPAAADTSCRPQRPAQKRLMEALTTPLVETLEAAYHRRGNAIDAVVVYCAVEEGCTMPTVPRRHAVSKEPADSRPRPDLPAESLLYTAVMSVPCHEKIQPEEAVRLYEL
ncbi:hypothetical protein EKO27_g11521 [Xylaria grammica]|uniref:Uncharacterized protein n=1 Tax=Xylaria grammica TaxID=363999 RepID=A0A439CN36_9PEZI|nr:hypothetical protein EKO27_g11521 [Xylaria grammica]